MAARETPVKVLLLGFEYTDLEELDDEATKVSTAFKSKGYEVEDYKIKMQQPYNGLSKKLRTFLSGEGALRILYYHGHGDFSSKDGPKFCSHSYPDNVHGLQDDARALWRSVKDDGLTPERRKEIARKYERYQDVSYVFWKNIGRQILDARHNVLTILDCCYAGGSVVSADRRLHDTIQTRTKYAKELLLAACWGSPTFDRMSPALCKALEEQWPDGALSVEELHEKMTKTLEEEGRRKEKEISKKRKKFEEDRKKFENERAKFEANKKRLTEERKTLLENKEKETEKSQAKKNKAKTKYNEPTSSMKSQDLQKVQEDINRLKKEKKEHEKTEVELNRKKKDLDTELLRLERNEAQLEEEVRQLKQPLYTRLYNSGDGDGPRVTLENLNPAREGL